MNHEIVGGIVNNLPIEKNDLRNLIFREERSRELLMK